MVDVDTAANQTNRTSIERLWVPVYTATAGIIMILMMLAGLLMRFAQAGWLSLDPTLFYQLMTVHGTGMVGIAALGGIAILIFYVSRYVELTRGVIVLNYMLFVTGVVLVLVADFIGGFGGAWTFLYPLPAVSQAVWPAWAAVMHLAGVLIIGVGFLILLLDVARAVIKRYGGIGRALGWHVLFGNSTENVPPPAVVAATMVVIVDVAALTVGAIIIIMNLIHTLFPAVEVDSLLAKNFTYFFGHVLINSTIYMAVIAVYEILPQVTKRPWKTTKVFLAAWNLSTVLVLIVFPHHLLMDFAMPKWIVMMGQVMSHMNLIPVLAVSGLGALAILHKSGIRWDLVTTLLFVAMFGWMAGVIPAAVDSTIAVNSVMHNTTWVPGHFHFYLLLGLLPMIFGFMLHLARGEDVNVAKNDMAAILYLFFGLGFVAMFLGGGWASVPRRWAEHLPEWMMWDQVASIMAIGIIVIATSFVFEFVRRMIMGPART